MSNHGFYVGNAYSLISGALKFTLAEEVARWIKPYETLIQAAENTRRRCKELLLLFPAHFVHTQHSNTKAIRKVYTQTNMDSTSLRDHNFNSDCTVEIERDQVVVRLSKDMLREKRKFTILLDVPSPPTLKSSAILQAKEADLSFDLSWDSDDDPKTFEDGGSCVESSPVIPVDDMRLELSRNFARLLERSPLRLEKDTQSSQTSLVPNAVVRAKVASSQDILTRHEPKRKFAVFDLPVEVRGEIYKYVTTAFEPSRGGCVCRVPDKPWCDHKNIDSEAIWRKAWDRRNTGILNINKQIRREFQSLNLEFAPACFLFEDQFCERVCLNAFEQLLNDRQLSLIRKVILRLRGSHMPDVRAKNCAPDMERLFSYMWSLCCRISMSCRRTLGDVEGGPRRGWVEADVYASAIGRGLRSGLRERLSCCSMGRWRISI